MSMILAWLPIYRYEWLKRCGEMSFMSQKSVSMVTVAQLQLDQHCSSASGILTVTGGNNKTRNGFLAKCACTQCSAAYKPVRMAHLRQQQHASQWVQSLDVATR